MRRKSTGSSGVQVVKIGRNEVEPFPPRPNGPRFGTHAFPIGINQNRTLDVAKEKYYAERTRMNGEAMQGILIRGRR